MRRAAPHILSRSTNKAHPQPFPRKGTPWSRLVEGHHLSSTVIRSITTKARRRVSRRLRNHILSLIRTTLERLLPPTASLHMWYESLLIQAVAIRKLRMDIRNITLSPPLLLGLLRRNMRVQLPIRSNNSNSNPPVRMRLYNARPLALR